MSVTRASAVGLTAGSLATFRLTRLITEDTITEPIRNWIWDRHPPESTKIGYLFTCPHCASIYAATAVCLLAAGELPAMPKPVRVASSLTLATLALSGAVSLYHEHKNA